MTSPARKGKGVGAQAPPLAELELETESPEILEQGPKAGEQPVPRRRLELRGCEHGAVQGLQRVPAGLGGHGRRQVAGDPPCGERHAVAPGRPQNRRDRRQADQDVAPAAFQDVDQVQRPPRAQALQDLVHARVVRGLELLPAREPNGARRVGEARGDRGIEARQGEQGPAAIARRHPDRAVVVHAAVRIDPRRCPAVIKAAADRDHIPRSKSKKSPEASPTAPTLFCSSATNASRSPEATRVR